MVRKAKSKSSSDYQMDRKQFLYILMNHQDKSLTELIAALTKEFGVLNAPRKGKKAMPKPLAPTREDIKVHLARARAAFAKDNPDKRLDLRIPKDSFDWSPFPSTPSATRRKRNAKAHGTKK